MKKDVNLIVLSMLALLLFAGCTNSHNGKFTKLNNVSFVPVYWSENEVFFPGGYTLTNSGSYGTSARIYNIKTRKFKNLMLQ